MFNRISIVMVVWVSAILLSACGTFLVETEVLDPPPEANTASQPSSEDTPEEADASEEEPETPAERSTLLPAAVLYLDQTNNQIWRMDADGQTTNQVTSATSQIIDFAVSSVDGTIVYVNGDNELVRINSDGSGQEILFDGGPIDYTPGADNTITNPTISPDGQTIAFGHEGIKFMPVAGGDATLLVGNEIDSNTPRASRLYRPLNWSPDGSKIAALQSMGQEGGNVIIVTVASAQVTTMNYTGEVWQTVCCTPAWTADSATMYFGIGTYGLLRPGLWRADASTGDVETLVEGWDWENISYPDSENAAMTLTGDPYPMPDGRLYIFAAQGTYNELFGEPGSQRQVPPLKVTSMSPDGSDWIVLNDAIVSQAWQPLWAADGTGALVSQMAMSSQEINNQLVWIPTDGSDMVPLSGAGIRMTWDAK